jgi:hypothetical protein
VALARARSNSGCIGAPWGQRRSMDGGCDRGDGDTTPDAPGEPRVLRDLRRSATQAVAKGSWCSEPASLPHFECAAAQGTNGVWLSLRRSTAAGAATTMPGGTAASTYEGPCAVALRHRTPTGHVYLYGRRAARDCAGRRAEDHHAPALFGSAMKPEGGRSPTRRYPNRVSTFRVICSICGSRAASP